MLERDLLVDRYLARRLKEAKYQSWKRHNILKLKEQYATENHLYRDGFEKFCRKIFDKNR